MKHVRARSRRGSKEKGTYLGFLQESLMRSARSPHLHEGVEEGLDLGGQDGVRGESDGEHCRWW